MPSILLQRLQLLLLFLGRMHGETLVANYVLLDMPEQLRTWLLFSGCFGCLQRVPLGAVFISYWCEFLLGLRSW